MPLFRITSSDTDMRLHGATAPMVPTLRRALNEDPGPITIMVHGYKYLPGDPTHCPYSSILANHPKNVGKRVVSWPRHLGLRGQKGEGLGISFGWSARGSIRSAWAAALLAGQQLAALTQLLSRLAPNRPIHLVAHSMGARVALQAMLHCPPDTFGNVILLAGAEFEHTAKQAILSAGAKTDVLNVTSRENDLYDFLIEKVVPRPIARARVLGHGGLQLPCLTTLQLDNPACLGALRKAGFPIAAPKSRICHWSPYTRPGVFPLYRAVLRGKITVPQIKALLTHDPSPRWSRLAPRVLRFVINHKPRGQNDAIGQV